MSTICDLCKEHDYKLQTFIQHRSYCKIADILGPMEGPYRVRDTHDDEISDDAPPYLCIKDEYVPGTSPIL